MEPQERNTGAVPAFEPTASRRHAMRLLRDAEDRIVLVYELTGVRESDPRTLVIESAADQSITRLAHYPANWRALKDAELLTLRVPRD